MYDLLTHQHVAIAAARHWSPFRRRDRIVRLRGPAYSKRGRQRWTARTSVFDFPTFYGRICVYGWESEDDGAGSDLRDGAARHWQQHNSYEARASDYI